MERDEKDNQRKILEKVLKNLREKRREAATQILHQEERYEIN